MWINMLLLFAIHMCFGLWLYDELSHWIASRFHWTIPTRERLLMILPVAVSLLVSGLFGWCVYLFHCQLPFQLCSG